jgi:hypothetical protein
MNKYPAECPFCKRYINPPEEVMTEFGNVLSGRCICGAVYVCDPTGRNVGEAYMEALAIAKGDWNIHLISEGKDYMVEEINYDLKSNTRIHSSSKTEMGGKLIFVRLFKKDSNFEVKKETKERAKSDLKGSSKSVIKELLHSMSYNKIAELAEADKSVIRHLISLAYDKDDVITWRAIEAMGYVSKRLSTKKIDVVRDTIRRLLWSMGEESGGIGWSSPEMLGEIIRGNPDEYADIIPILWSFKEEKMFRAGVVWAMARIAQIRPEMINFIFDDFQDLLLDDNPHVRGYAVWLIGILKRSNLLSFIKELLEDKKIINFYLDGELLKINVGQLAKEVKKELLAK